MSRKTPKKRTKKKNKKNNLQFIIAVIIIILMGYVFYINKGLFLPDKTKEIAATVNGEEITSEEVEQGYNMAKEQNDLLTEDEFLDQLVSLKLLLQDATKNGIITTKEEVDKEINNLIEVFGSEEELEEALKDMKSSKEDLYGQIERQISINKLINLTITSKIEVLESETLSFYEENQDILENISYVDVKDQIHTILINEKTNTALDTFIKQLKEDAKIVLSEKDTEEKNEFLITEDEICEKDKKPIIRLYTTTTCSQCKEVKQVFDSTVTKLVGQEKIVAYHWELDTGDNTLTPEKETGIPKSEVEIFKKYNKESTVPTYVMGCKYVRIGNAYNTFNEDTEKAEIENTIEVLSE